MARCPCHDDKKQSLSIGRGEKGVVMKCHAGCETSDIAERVGLKLSDLFDEQEKPSEKKQIVATYNYPNGVQKVRYSNKELLWRRPDGKGGWIWNRKGVPRTLYIAGKLDGTVAVAEGEKDADNLHRLGWDAASGENGAGPGKWRKEYTQQLKGLHVVIFQDNDKIGKSFASETAAALHGVAASVRVLDLSLVWPEIPEHGDVSDMIAKFGDDKASDMIADLLARTPEWKPPKEQDIFDSFGFYSVPDLTPEEKKPPEFIIDGMIPCGMTFLSGAPKTRKSFLALQMAIAVATGRAFWGHDVKQCSVAYLDLEGSKSRISYRTTKMSTPIPRNVYITNSVTDRLADGLVDKLRQLHRQMPEIRLVIIDTFSRARGSFKAGSANAYDADVSLLEPVHRMALEENIAVLFVHHDKKGAGFVSDSFERLSGTMGISGSADCVINLMTEGKRFDGRATLEYTPRDAKGGELSLVFDDRFMEWMAEAKPDLRGNPVCGWILQNVPEKGREGHFWSYEDVFSSAYKCLADNPGDKVLEQVKPHREELFSGYGVGVQLGCKSNGKRGLRIINLQ